MPALGIECPRGRVSFAECKTCSEDPLRPCHYPPEMLRQMQPDYGEKPDASDFTPSRLLNCFRQPVLMESNDYWINAEYQYASMRGTTIHDGLQHIGHESKELILREVRFETLVDTQYGPQKFSAQPDYVVVYLGASPDGSVEIAVKDFKTGDVDHDLVAADRNYQMQANMYAWILSRELPTYLLEQHQMAVTDVKVRWIEIQYLGATKPRRFISLGELKANGKRIPRTKPQEYEILSCAPVTLLPMERVGKFVKARIEAKMKAREELPPPLEGDAAKWCFRCAVWSVCGQGKKGEAA